MEPLVYQNLLQMLCARTEWEVVKQDRVKLPAGLVTVAPAITLNVVYYRRRRQMWGGCSRRVNLT